MGMNIFNQIYKHQDSFVLHVLTHSSEKTDKNEIYDMINTGINGVIEAQKKKKERNVFKFSGAPGSEKNQAKIYFSSW